MDDESLFRRLRVETVSRLFMAQHKPPTKTKKQVWRITDAAPLGEIVDPDAAATPVPAREDSERSAGGWVVSSFELLHGAEVNEDESTIPGELFDELFAPQVGKPKPADKK
jgi:hypothetical protein